MESKTSHNVTQIFYFFTFTCLIRLSIWHGDRSLLRCRSNFSKSLKVSIRGRFETRVFEIVVFIEPGG